jgi:hypothetical protein
MFFEMDIDVSKMNYVDLATQISCTNYEFLDTMKQLGKEPNRAKRVRLLRLAMKLETMYTLFVDEYNRRDVNRLLSDDSMDTSYRHSVATYDGYDEV